VGDQTLKAKDLQKVHKALMLYAHHLVGVARFADFDQLVTAGECGETAEDLASETLLRFLDPGVKTVKWKATEEVTVSGLIGFLKRVLKNDFLDMKKREKFRQQLEPSGEANDEVDDSPGMERFATSTEPADLVAIRHQQRATVIRYFEQWPELLDILKVQIQPDGSPDFTNIELAQLLETSVSDIENRKKRISRAFVRFAQERR
jgi:DNA-directed RNA polymerase specialized sigma24 family protein